ncbi:MAG: STAS domain-containing protein [Candidatus Riflebacteria bacterium]|nr:STAS domain-containing protein [Candidatus Riflebacteria bacterium]
MITFTCRTDRGIIIFDIGGEVCIYNVDKLKEAVNLSKVKGVYNFIFNISNVEYLDSTAIQYLLAFSHELKGNKGRLVIVNPNEDVLHTLSLCRAERILTITSSEYDALNQLTMIT